MGVEVNKTAFRDVGKICSEAISGKRRRRLRGLFANLQEVYRERMRGLGGERRRGVDYVRQE